MNVETPPTLRLPTRPAVVAVAVLELVYRLLMQLDASNPVVLVLWACFIALAARWYWRVVRRKDPSRPKLQFKTTAAAVGLVVASILVIALGMHLFRSTSDIPALRGYRGGLPSGKALFGFLLIYVVGTPVIEEIEFRGVIFTWFGDRWGGAAAVVGSTALFVGSHLTVSSRVPYLLDIAVGGVVLALLRLRTRGIGLPMAVHAAVNFLAHLA